VVWAGLVSNMKYDKMEVMKDGSKIVVKVLERYSLVRIY
jgi:hypothetical protein